MKRVIYMFAGALVKDRVSNFSLLYAKTTTCLDTLGIEYIERTWSINIGGLVKPIEYEFAANQFRNEFSNIRYVEITKVHRWYPRPVGYQQLRLLQLYGRKKIHFSSFQV